MLGLIATIIAAKKGHKTFAWIIGVWTAAEIVMLFLMPKYAFGPGALFLMIALMMKKEGSVITPEESKNRVMIYCKSCDFATSAELEDDSARCPKCGGQVLRTETSRDAWNGMTTDEKIRQKRQWIKDSEA